MTPPLITVLLPVYNGARHLREAIDSILSQTFTDFELLIVSDPCSDSSIDIIKSCADPRMRLVQNPQKLGLVKSLNKGLELARGAYIARQDSDDISLSGRLAAQVGFLEANPSVVLSGAMGEVIDSTGAKLYLSDWRPLTHSEIKWSLLWACQILHSSVMFRKQQIVELGGYSDNCAQAEDYHLWSRLALEYPMMQLADVLVKYRFSEESACSSNAPEVLSVSLRIARDNMQTLLGHPVPAEVVAAATDFSSGALDEGGCLPQACELQEELFQAFKAQGNEITGWIKADYAARMRRVVLAYFGSANARPERLKMLVRGLRPLPGVYAPLGLPRYLLKLLLGPAIVAKIKNTKAALLCRK